MKIRNLRLLNQREFGIRKVVTEQETTGRREEKQTSQDQDNFLYKSAFIEGHIVIFSEGFLTDWL